MPAPIGVDILWEAVPGQFPDDGDWSDATTLSTEVQWFNWKESLGSFNADHQYANFPTGGFGIDGTDWSPYSPGNIVGDVGDRQIPCRVRIPVADGTQSIEGWIHEPLVIYRPVPQTEWKMIHRWHPIAERDITMTWNGGTLYGLLTSDNALTRIFAPELGTGATFDDTKVQIVTQQSGSPPVGFFEFTGTVGQLLSLLMRATGYQVYATDKVYFENRLTPQPPGTVVLVDTDAFKVYTSLDTKQFGGPVRNRVIIPYSEEGYRQNRKQTGFWRTDTPGPLPASYTRTFTVPAPPERGTNSNIRASVSRAFVEVIEATSQFTNFNQIAELNISLPRLNVVQTANANGSTDVAMTLTMPDTFPSYEFTQEIVNASYQLLSTRSFEGPPDDDNDPRYPFHLSGVHPALDGYRGGIEAIQIEWEVSWDVDVEDLATQSQYDNALSIAKWGVRPITMPQLATPEAAQNILGFRKDPIKQHVISWPIDQAPSTTARSASLNAIRSKFGDRKYFHLVDNVRGVRAVAECLVAEASTMWSINTPAVRTIKAWEVGPVSEFRTIMVDNRALTLDIDDRLLQLEVA